MSERCTAMRCCFSFLLLGGLTFLLTLGPWRFFFSPRDHDRQKKWLVVHPAVAARSGYTVKCSLSEKVIKEAPLMESFIQATAKSEDQEILLNGLAVYPNLTNACQPLEDVSKVNIQVHKVALVSLNNNNYSLCPLNSIAVNAQNAGYSVLICFTDERLNMLPQKKAGELSKHKVLIPVLNAVYNDCQQVIKVEDSFDIKYFLTHNDQTNVEIKVPPHPEFSSELEKIDSYLHNLHYWFLVGPIITLGWLSCTKKFCRMPGGQQAQEGRVARNGTDEIRDMEEAANSNEESHPNSVTEETVENHDHGTDDGRQPLLVNNPEYTRQTTVRYVINIIKKIPYKLAVGLCYLNLIIAALPVGISSGGLSFFRFDERDAIWTRPTSYFGELFDCTKDSDMSGECSRLTGLETFLPIYWSPFQVFSFFMYSRFACKTTWTVQTNFSKLIRSDWFASNVYLLVLGIVMPVCSFLSFNFLDFSIYVAYDTVCTISNGLFIIILNKHKFVTRYVFYISVCMIFAYLESDVVAVFYFALNSEGSSSSLKLTALRTVAIGLTLSISFSSSMHIIRKLVKPEESLFEGLGEK